MEAAIVALLATGLVLGGGAFVFLIRRQDEHRKELLTHTAALVDKIDALAEKVASIDKSLAVLTVTVNGLSEKVDAQSVTIARIEDRLTAHGDRLAVLEARSGITPPPPAEEPLLATTTG